MKAKAGVSRSNNISDLVVVRSLYSVGKARTSLSQVVEEEVVRLKYGSINWMPITTATAASTRRYSIPSKLLMMQAKLFVMLLNLLRKLETCWSR